MIPKFLGTTTAHGVRDGASTVIFSPHTAHLSTKSAKAAAPERSNADQWPSRHCARSHATRNLSAGSVRNGGGLCRGPLVHGLNSGDVEQRANLKLGGYAILHVSTDEHI